MAVFDALDYLSSPPEVPQPLTAANITPQTRIQARVVLRDIRHVVNEYRDDRRVGLVRTRNNLLWTGTVTGLVGFLLLALAILREVEETAVVAAMVFFLVGATVGLFNQLSSGWGNPEGGATEEDYGLARARLLNTPLLSGLAAVGGVLITTMLYATLSGPIVTTPEPSTVQTTPSANNGEAAPSANNGEAAPSAVILSVPQVTDIFNLNGGRFGLVIAAIFGLTPGLLINRLQGEAEKYQADLQSSTAQGGT